MSDRVMTRTLSGVQGEGYDTENLEAVQGLVWPLLARCSSVAVPREALLRISPGSTTRLASTPTLSVRRHVGRSSKG